MKKKTVISVMVVVMLFAVSLFFVGGTYARYATDFSGNAEGDIAAWKVKIGESETLTLNFTPETETGTVVGSKIAPGRKLKADVELNLEGTEVAVDVEASLEQAKQAITTAFGLSADKVSISTSMSEGGTTNGDGSTTIALKDGAAFGADDKYTLTITIEWTNDDSNNSDDTSVGKGESLNYSLPVTLKAQQHLSSDVHTGD